MVKITKDLVGRHARISIWERPVDPVDGIIVSVDSQYEWCSFLSENGAFFGCVTPDKILEIGNKISGETGLSDKNKPAAFYRYNALWYCVKNGKISVGDTPEQAELEDPISRPRDMELALIDALYEVCEKDENALDARCKRLLRN